MFSVPYFKAEVEFEQDKYNPDKPNNIGSRISIIQSLKKSNGDELTIEETQKYMEDNRNKTSICVLLDKSGSMDGFPLENAKKVIKHMVQYVLCPNDYFSLITFDSTCNLVINKMMIGGNLEHILTEISIIESGSCTNIPDAIKLGLDIMNTPLEGYSKNIILFTDGQNTIGPRNCKEIISELNNANPDWSKTSINCCGFGSEVDLETLNLISKESESKIIVIEHQSNIISDFVDMFLNLIHQNNKEVLIRFEHSDQMLPENLMMSELREVYKSSNVQKYRLPKTIIGENNKFNISFQNIEASYFTNLKIELEIHDIKHKSYESQKIEFQPIYLIGEPEIINYEISIDFLEIEYQKTMKIFNQSNDNTILKKFYKRCKNTGIPVDNPRFKELISNLEKFKKPINNYNRARLSMYSSPYVIQSRNNDEVIDSPLRYMSSQMTSEII